MTDEKIEKSGGIESSLGNLDEEVETEEAYKERLRAELKDELREELADENKPAEAEPTTVVSRRYRCVRPCYVRNQRWKPDDGKVLTVEFADEEAVKTPDHFVEIGVNVKEDVEAGYEGDAVELSDVKAALLQLNFNKKEHWTKAGLPVMSVVESLLGRETTRKEVEKAFPGFCQDTKTLKPKSLLE
ncbi:hypothetical protein KAR91_23820 [Candidatus Pacearchaeota archaeon]|nr:hypothetical protein [Candidatus Pacearchaeota archaeon]